MAENERGAADGPADDLSDGYTPAEKAAAGLALLILASLALLAVDMICDGRLIGGRSGD